MSVIVPSTFNEKFIKHRFEKIMELICIIAGGILILIPGILYSGFIPALLSMFTALALLKVIDLGTDTNLFAYMIEAFLLLGRSVVGSFFFLVFTLGVILWELLMALPSIPRSIYHVNRAAWTDFRKGLSK